MLDKEAAEILMRKVVHSLGSPHSFGPPETGHQFELDLAGLARMKSLPFDAAKKSYLPIPGQRLVVDNLYVDERGGFSTMRLVAKGETSTLRIDISPKPNTGSTAASTCARSCRVYCAPPA